MNNHHGMNAKMKKKMTQTIPTVVLLTVSFVLVFNWYCIGTL